MSTPDRAQPSRRLSLTDLGTTLTVWAHPDDETYLAGGLVAALRDQGNRVVCVTATRGEAADPASQPDARAALARLRTDELAAALDVLGVHEHRWLDYADGECAGVDADLAAARLGRLIDQVQADTVVTFGPDGFTGHPDHRATSEWTRRAVAASARRPRLLHAVTSGTDHAAANALSESLGVYALGRPRVCDDHDIVVRVALRGKQLVRKVSALRCQHSQTGALIETMGAEQYADWVSVETFATPVAAETPVPRRPRLGQSGSLETGRRQGSG